jgi:hypothetical protein
MPIDKPILTKLKKFAKVFADARDRDANESDTVMYLIEFFKEVLDYDPLSGEISKEIKVDDWYCDFGIRLDDKIAFLVEAKQAGVPGLKGKYIAQAENYASHAGINWVLLTNGVLWQLYHLTFDNGIQRELVFDVNFLDDLEQKPDWVWDTLSVLDKRNVREESLDTYYERQKLLSPKNLVNLLLGEEVLMKLRQELNHKAPSRLELTTVFEAVRDILSQEALAIAAEIMPPSKRQRRRKHRKDDVVAEGECAALGGQGAAENKVVPPTVQLIPAAQVTADLLPAKPPIAPSASS